GHPRSGKSPKWGGAGPPPEGNGRRATITTPSGGSALTVPLTADSDRPWTAMNVTSCRANGTFAATAIGRPRDPSEPISAGDATSPTRTVHPSAWENVGGTLAWGACPGGVGPGAAWGGGGVVSPARPIAHIDPHTATTIAATTAIRTPRRLVGGP